MKLERSAWYWIEDGLIRYRDPARRMKGKRRMRRVILYSRNGWKEGYVLRIVYGEIFSSDKHQQKQGVGPAENKKRRVPLVSPPKEILSGTLPVGIYQSIPCCSWPLNTHTHIYIFLFFCFLMEIGKQGRSPSCGIPKTILIGSTNPKLNSNNKKPILVNI